MMGMFKMSDLLSSLSRQHMGGGAPDPTQNYPGGTPDFDEGAYAKNPGDGDNDMGMEPDGDMDDRSMSPMPVGDSSVPRQILRSPFGGAMDRERKLR